MGQIDCGFVAHRERTGQRLEAQITVMARGVGIGAGQHWLTDMQVFPHQGLVGRLRGMDVENEIATRVRYFITQRYRKVQSQYWSHVAHLTSNACHL